MASKRRAHDEDAWTNAKKVCRLTTRQIEMARALGMNPRELLSLRPSPQQRWKLPVGAFIEDRYRERFGGERLDRRASVADPDLRKSEPPQPHVLAPERVRDAAPQVEDLVCYLMNLADDLQRWLAHGSVAPEVLRQVREELQQVVAALDNGASISPMPAIPLPPRAVRRDFSQRDDTELAFDDKIPF